MEKENLTIEILKEAAELWTLENEFLREIGEEPMVEDDKERLSEAIRAGKIIFWIAKANNEPVGMCSISPCFSTFACKECGVFDDFFIKPSYRGQGAARMLVSSAQTWCKKNGYASIMVGCSQGDVGMYQSLGFDTVLGTMMVNNL